MVKIYAISLALGVIGLLVTLLGGAFAENVGHPERDPGRLVGFRGKAAIGALIGFGMGGLSAEFSPLDLAWPVSLTIAVIAAALSVFWVKYAVSLAND